MTNATPPPAGDDDSDDPALDPDDAGFPTPDLADGDVDFTDEDGEVKGSGLG